MATTINNIKIPEGLTDLEIVPGNGKSPHTGYTIFRARCAKLSKDPNRGKLIAIKMGTKPINDHHNIFKEYSLLTELESNKYVMNVFEYEKINNHEFILMENLPYGGRRSRWRETMKYWSEHKFRVFIRGMFKAIKSLNEVGIKHGDVELANIGSRSTASTPVLFDFGKFTREKTKNVILRNQLSLAEKTSNNAWAREIFGIGGQYAKEGIICPLDKDYYYNSIILEFPT